MRERRRQSGRPWFVLVLICWFGVALSPQQGHASKGYDLQQELSDGFDATYRWLSWGTLQRAANTDQNRNNDFAKLPGTLLTGELRPDFSLFYRNLDFSLKPRLNVEWQQIDQGGSAGETQTETELFINEWRARILLQDRLLISYGRENLQWGPSYLSSPSNPFFSDNGRSSLNAEIRGSDFARLVWLPTASWTLSAIVNSGDGAAETDEPFSPVYALKLDWVGYDANAGLIASKTEGSGKRLGGFAGWTASDALLIYAEGRLQQGSAALYPIASDNPLGMSLEAIRDDDSNLYGVGLLGFSYTLAVGPTLSVEYLYNGPGYSRQQAEDYYELRERAAMLYTSMGPLSEFGAQILADTAAPGLNFLRRHYLMLQYSHSDIADRFSLTGRITLNLEDHSSRIYGSLVYSMNDHIELFTTGVLNSSQSQTEFGSMVHYQWTLGLTYVF